MQVVHHANDAIRSQHALLHCAGWATECCQEQVLRRRDAVQAVHRPPSISTAYHLHLYLLAAFRLPANLTCTFRATLTLVSCTILTNLTCICLTALRLVGLTRYPHLHFSSPSPSSAASFPTPSPACGWQP